MIDSSVQIAQRPKIISIVSVVVIISAAFLTLLSFTPSAYQLATLTYGSGAFLSVIVSLVGSLVYVIAMIGYWKMQKWGVYLYVAQAGISLVLNNFLLKIYSNIFLSAGTLVFPVIVAIIGFVHLKKMELSGDIRKEPLFLVGSAGVAIATILQLILFFAYPHAGLQSLSGNLPPAASLSQSELANAKDCGADFACFVSAAQTCASTKMLAQFTGNVAGLISTVQDQLIIYGTSDNCTLTITAVSGSVKMSDQLIAQYRLKGRTDAEIQQAQAQFAAASQNANYSRLGIKTCHYNSDSLITVLNDAQKTGSFSTNDDLLGQCRVSRSTSTSVTVPLKQNLSTALQNSAGWQRTFLGPAGTNMGFISVALPPYYGVQFINSSTAMVKLSGALYPSYLQVSVNPGSFSSLITLAKSTYTPLANAQHHLHITTTTINGLVATEITVAGLNQDSIILPVSGKTGQDGAVVINKVYDYGAGDPTQSSLENQILDKMAASLQISQTGNASTTVSTGGQLAPATLILESAKNNIYFIGSSYNIIWTTPDWAKGQPVSLVLWQGDSSSCGVDPQTGVKFCGKVLGGIVYGNKNLQGNFSWQIPAAFGTGDNYRITLLLNGILGAQGDPFSIRSR